MSEVVRKIGEYELSAPHDFEALANHLSRARTTNQSNRTYACVL